VRKHRILTILAMICLFTMLLPLTVSAAQYPDNGWVRREDLTWGYRQNGQWLADTVTSIGGVYYGFDENGVMQENEEFWCNGTSSWYRAKSSGALYVNAWYLDADNTWYYYGPGGKAQIDFLKVGGQWYFFFENGAMAQDQFVWSEAYHNYYAIDKSGANYAVLNQKGWNQVFDREYYVYEEPDSYNNTLRVLNAEVMTLGGVTYCFKWNGHLAAGELCSYYDAEKGREVVCYATDSGAVLEPGWRQIGSDTYYVLDGFEICRDGVYEIADKLYHFDENGQLITGRRFHAYNPEAEAWCEMIATDSGTILQNGWGKIGGVWYYADGDGALYLDGIYEISGQLYLFLENGSMYAMPGEYGEYYVTASGSLLRNTWRDDSTGSLSSVGKTYYGSDGCRVTGLQSINGKVYFFNSRGIMQTNRVEVTESGVYVFGADGVGKPAEGWLRCPQTQKMMYIADGAPVRDTVMEIAGKTYGFDQSGYMVVNGPWLAEDWFLFDENGHWIKTAGWKKRNNQWYYVENSGYLAVGWITVGKTLYCLDPVMQCNTVLQNPQDGLFYAINKDGACTPLSGDGWKTYGQNRYYLSKGVPLSGCWKQLGATWYYFDSNGCAVTNGTYTVGKLLYLFDMNGKMHTGGWLYTDNGTYYAGSDGVAYTGMKTIGGKRYIFDMYGRMQQGRVVSYEAANYLLALDGSVLTQINKDGWVQVGKDWYYVEDGQLCYNRLVPSGKLFYGLGSDGKMCTGGIHYAWWDYYLFDANGVIKTGWHRIDGNWYYGGRTDKDPALAYDGIYTIGGKDYAFRDGIMQTGSFVMDDMLITTDSSGSITQRETLPEGWVYTGDGYIYRKNGETFYTGWVGDFFARDGKMVFAQRVEYGGRYYYMKANGKYLQSGWHLTADGAYVYAKNGGVLYCNEWLKEGNIYYYFQDGYMVSDTVLQINGKLESFDKSGKWLGTVSAPSPLPARADGWYAANGKWQYYRAGAPVTGRQYIGGNWYCFYSDGIMLENTFDKEGRYYYGTGGAQASYRGWHQVGGSWYYFSEENTAYSGWIPSGKGWYYTDCVLDEATGGYLRKMVANTCRSENGKLYQFNADGYTGGPVNKTSGWYQAGSEWYYFENGLLVQDGYRKIGGAGYYFQAGKMQKNVLAYVEDTLPGGMRYFGANGKEVTNIGWLNTKYGWIYVGAGGRLYENGIYRIGSTDYAFRNGLWIAK